MARVAEARLVYAKKERDPVWEREAEDRMAEAIRRVLGSTTD